MKGIVSSMGFWAIIFFSLLAFVMTTSNCRAAGSFWEGGNGGQKRGQQRSQAGSRKGKSEIFILAQSMSGDKTTGLGVSTEFDDTIVWGVGYGANFNDHLNLNTDLFFGSTDITGGGFGETIEGDTTLVGWDLNLDYNILKYKITPMVTGGIGFISFNGDFGASASDFSEVDFSYNIGGGVRWDVTAHFLIKLLYRATWTNLKDSDDSILFDGISLSLGYVF